MLAPVTAMTTVVPGVKSSPKRKDPPCPLRKPGLRGDYRRARGSWTPATQFDPVLDALVLTSGTFMASSLSATMRLVSGTHSFQISP